MSAQLAEISALPALRGIPVFWTEMEAEGRSLEVELLAFDRRVAFDEAEDWVSRHQAPWRIGGKVHMEAFVRLPLLEEGLPVLSDGDEEHALYLAPNARVREPAPVFRNISHPRGVCFLLIREKE